MDKKRLIKIGTIAFWVLLFFIQFTAVAYALDQRVYPPDSIDLPGSSQSTISGFIADVVTKILLPLTGILAVLFIIIGGFQYITSAGNEEQAESGKKTLTNAIIGLVVVILSYVVVRVIITTLNI